MTRYISYCRVSTLQQGQSQLGLEAQKAAVKAFLKTQDSLIAKYQEVKAGKRIIA